jgi:hypothetical protein
MGEENKCGLLQQELLQNFASSRGPWTHGPIGITLGLVWVSSPQVGNH